MGRRIDEWLSFFRFLRTTKPKYSFEVFIFHVVLGFAAGFSVILGETWLWMLSCGVLWISLTLHYWRVRREIAKQEREWFERATISLEQAIAAYEQAKRARERKPISPAELALLREDVERAREREAASE